MPSRTAPAGVLPGPFDGAASIPTDSLIEGALRRAGLALQRWADERQARRLRRAGADAIGLTAVVNDTLRRDLGLHDGLRDAALARQALTQLHWQAWR